MRDTMLLNDGWEFSLCMLGSDMDKARSWGAVTLPHDWLIYDTNDLYKNSTGWYRKTLEIPADGRRTSVRFEGVYMNCRVYVNRQLAGKWKYGYTTFELDITDLLRDGKNELAVRVDHQEPNSRWYSGAGIFRRVFLQRFEQSHFTADGLYISADDQGNITVTAETERPVEECVDGYSLRVCIYDPEGEEYELIAEAREMCLGADKRVLPAPVVRDGFRYTQNTVRMRVDGPRLWDITDPQLYVCTVELYRDGELMDVDGSDFGFRKMEFTPDRGFFLNGRHIKLQGVCEHHDLGMLGAAFNKAAMKRKFLTLRTMGVNAVRTSHNPPAVELLELADEMGFMILDEAFDMWELEKTKYDYARFFPEWVERDVASWIRRDRNHPCIIGWSIGNEIYDTAFSDRGQEVTALLNHLVRIHDPRGNAVVTIGSNHMPSERAQRCGDILKVPGYNYAERLYEEHHAAHPDWCIYGSETSSVVQSRGIYHFPASESLLSYDDKQCSALGNSSPGWAARSDEACILPDRNLEYCAGQFIWTGFDYIGEPTPYDTKNSYFGKIDTAGFPKDSFYLYKAAWTDYRTEPFIHLYPHWDWNEGQVIDLRAATNCPRAEIWFNGRLIARKDIDHSRELSLDTSLEYHPGEVTAVAYDEKGQAVARDVIRSFGDTASLRLTADKTVMQADGRDIIFISIEAFDKDGTFVANANNSVTVRVEGAGRLLGLDNGDSTDYEQYKTVRRRMFSGRLLAMVGAKDEPGDIQVTVTSPGLPDTVIALKSEACEHEYEEGRFLEDVQDRLGICYGELKTVRSSREKVVRPKDEVPVRRIVITARETSFSEERRSLWFGIKALPENNTYPDSIRFKLMTNSCIPSNLGKITEISDEGITVEALGDGKMVLCAYTENGGDVPQALSMLELTAEGLGSAATDPYELVAGGLCTIGNNFTNGIEQGAAFLNGGGWFGFEVVDFGELGSDTIVLPVFANYNTPVRIRIYDGTPEEGELLGDYEYALPPKWMVYQEQEYVLPKILKGVHTISLASDQPYDVKGFRFVKRVKERCELFAAEALNVYGDRFTLEDRAVSNIGNNVMLNFGQFDLGEGDTHTIYIKGRSSLPVNSIHVIFTGDTETRLQADFTAAADYTERSFTLPQVRGKCGVELVFLPGSDFDLMSIRFGD